MAQQYTTEEINNAVDRMVNMNILSNYGQYYTISDKFKESMAYNMMLHPNLRNNIDMCIYKTLFDYFDTLSENETVLYKSIIDTQRND